MARKDLDPRGIHGQAPFFQRDASLTPDIMREEVFIDEARRVISESLIVASNKILPLWPNPLNPRWDATSALQIVNVKEGAGNFALGVDKLSEGIIVGAFRKNSVLKNVDIIAEEDYQNEQRRPNSPVEVHIDGLDGTLNFANGLPFFAISVGMLDQHGQGLVGGIAIPERRHMIIAQRGRGAKLFSFDGDELLDLRENHMGKSHLPLLKSVVGHDVGYTGREEQIHRLDLRVASKVGSLVSYYSTVYGLAELAKGNLSAYLFISPKSYDVAAHATILPESGYFIGNIYGGLLDASNPQHGILAARDQETFLALAEPQHF